MTLILDASSAVSMILDPIHPKSNFENEIVLSSDNVICPDIFISEITNAFWKYCIYGKMEISDAKKYGNSVLALIDIFIRTETLWQEALEIGFNTQHSTYDCFYLALARKEKAVLITRDKKLKKIAIAENILVELP